ncbi:FliH/SctL family protein [Prosthecomicrobium sp. N25]|uniref:FliH/SctL family protein n=1 Tax=Prosthecomicrobium sp. N25 TaxID=3129254 RepID=UPI003077D62A
MAAPARFLFDLDFAAPPPKPAEEIVEAVPETPKVELDFHLAEVAAAEARARAEGYEEGRRAAEVRAAERLADEAAVLVASSRALLAALEADRLAIEKQAVDLAMAAARKLAGALVDREPTAAVRALLAECLGPLRKSPHLVLRLREDSAEAVRASVDRIARETGFEGRIVILGEPEIARGDCRIEWADGGIVRDSAAIAAGIEAAVQQYFTAREQGVDEHPPHTDPVRPGERI